MSVPRVKLMELREYVSDRTGATYFSGFLGKAKVVVLRDDRAEVTGREKARWSVLLEEAQPREAGSPQAAPRRRDDITAPPPAGRRGGEGEPESPMPERDYRSKARPQSPMRKGTTKSPVRDTSADRRAGDVMREHGIDPSGEMSRDEIPF